MIFARAGELVFSLDLIVVMYRVIETEITMNTISRLMN